MRRTASRRLLSGLAIISSLSLCQIVLTIPASRAAYAVARFHVGLRIVPHAARRHVPVRSASPGAHAATKEVGVEFLRIRISGNRILYYY